MKWSVNEVMYNSQAQKEFAKLFKDTFGKGVVCGSCPGNLYRDYFKLKNYLSLPSNEQDMQSTKNFVLNTGALISFKGVTYSEKYLPEAVCIEMLLARPELRKKFKVVNEELLKEAPKVQVAAVIDEVTGDVVVIDGKEPVKLPAKRGRKSKK
jgi:hypothetical protein